MVCSAAEAMGFEEQRRQELEWLVKRSSLGEKDMYIV